MPNGQAVTFDHKLTPRSICPALRATITKVCLPEDEDVNGLLWPTLTLRLATGAEIEVEISCDDEGNGPGVIHGLPRRLRKAATA